MCGIAGIYHRSGTPPGDWKTVLERMTRTLVHRGPDDEGYFIDDHIGLGHRRLSVIDLETGRQPISNEDGTVWVVFNGEIYNYADLTALLEHKGHVFRTRSDTEAIVHAYEEWGVSCLDRFRGMFAFAVWDQRRRRLFLARDRLGKKPLYYATVGDAFIFGSEIKALLAFPGLDRTLDLEAVNDYLTLRYVPREKSIFRQIRKLPAGHCLVAEDGGARARCYWDIHFGRAPAGDGSAAGDVAALLRQAVALRLRSDVPLGAFLSGGLDSSAVVGLMAEAAQSPVTTTSIGFPEAEFDELPYARLVARHFNTAHHERVVMPAALDVLDRLVWHYDEPFADSSAVPTYYVAQLARAHVTVALSGDGGDESFAGYRRYFFDVRENMVRALVPAALRRPVFGLLGALYPKADVLPQIFRGKAFLSNLARTPWDAYLYSVSGIHDDDRTRLLSGDVRRALAGYHTGELFEDLYRAADGPDSLSRIQYIDFKTYLPDDILTKVDRASMAHSLEVRCPLLDHHLVEYVAALPSALKLKGAHTKLVLKEAVRGLLPPEILARPKMGFLMPINLWLRTALRPLLHDHVLAPTRHDLFDPSTVRLLCREHESGRRDRATELWIILMFNLWYDRFVSDAPSVASASRAPARRPDPVA